MKKKKIEPSSQSVKVNGTYTIAGPAKKNVPSQVINNTQERGALNKIMTMLLNMTTPLLCETELFERASENIFIAFQSTLLCEHRSFLNVETVVKVSYVRSTAKLYQLIIVLLKEANRFQRFILENSV